MRIGEPPTAGRRPRLTRHVFTVPGSVSAVLCAALLGYPADNRDNPWYGDRPKRGQPIGTGLIEGGCKNIIAALPKLNSARWWVRRAERMAAIRCLRCSGLWDAYWNKPHHKKAA